MAKGMYKEGGPKMYGTTDEWSHPRVIGTGMQIKRYLEPDKADFPMNIWRHIKAENKKYGYHHPTWEAFRNYFFRLRALKLVIAAEGGPTLPSTAHRTRSRSPHMRTVAYRLNPNPPFPAQRNGIVVTLERAWENPQDACYKLLW